MRTVAPICLLAQSTMPARSPVSGCEPRLEVRARRRGSARRRSGVSCEHGRVGPFGHGEHERPDRAGVGVADVLGHGRRADLAAADQVGGQRVQDAGQQAAAAESGHRGDGPQDLGLHAQAEGERRAAGCARAAGLCGRRGACRRSGPSGTPPAWARRRSSGPARVEKMPPSALSTARRPPCSASRDAAASGVMSSATRRGMTGTVMASASWAAAIASAMAFSRGLVVVQPGWPAWRLARRRAGRSGAGSRSPGSRGLVLLDQGMLGVQQGRGQLGEHRRLAGTRTAWRRRCTG